MATFIFTGFMLNMKIRNNYSTQTFTSKRDIRKICLKTLNEFNLEFKGIKSPTKLFQDSENAKCETKRKLFNELAAIFNRKYKNLKTEYYRFLLTQPNLSYQETMEKLAELMHKHKVTNCGFSNNYYQYMLAKKGVGSELCGIQVYNQKPRFNSDRSDKNHLFLNIKESQNTEKLCIADTWLNTVKDKNTYDKELFEYMNINPKKQYVYFEHLELKGYKEFVANAQSNQAKKV